MSRRNHRKSRNGCSGCKSRHIKCDETLPTCVNCRTADRVCSFSSQTWIQQQPYPSPSSTTASISVQSPVHLGGPPQHTGGQEYVVNTDHVELLCHFCTEVMKDFQPTGVANNPFSTFQQYIDSAPYLLHEVLAMSALHLSLLHLHKQEYYRNYAAGLQTRALSLFSTVVEIDKDNCTPAIMFCALVGVHVLCDTLRYREGDLNKFLDGFTHFFRLHRGVRTVASTAWDILRQTELETSLSIPSKIAEIADAGTECNSLHQMLEEADIGQTSLEAYQATVKHLQWAFDMDRCAQTMPESKQMLFSWTILVPSEYTDLLMQRRPEALIILAYYGVILHRHRDLWVVGDGGEFLIQSIGKFLGPYWERWLVWPNSTVA